ncbi:MULTISPECIES: phage portal protein [unclassified Ensifer]|uniref:phage portal protein n=1 Tax=unclassified Ensifer TaxID=2633371 RepID=UPI00300FF55C
MDLFRFFRREPVAASASVQSIGGGEAYSVTDPAFLEAIRRGLSSSGRDVLLNGAINRSVRLLSESIGMLPIHLHWQDEQKGKATDHPVYRVLHKKPNNWQTPYEFKRLMQAVLLRKGVSYAQIVKSRGQVLQLQPLAKFNVDPLQNADWSISYKLTSPNGVTSTLRQDEVFVLRDMDIEDGVCGSSRVSQAKDAIDLSRSIRRAAQKLFDNGLHVGGSISSPTKLSPEARANLKASMAEKTGAGNAGKWFLLEEGLEAKTFAQSLSDSLQVENLAAQTEEIARIFGVPRPLLMMDETAWGSGIEALGQFFVTYGLAPQFVNWEQAVARSVLTEDETAIYEAKFNEAALLRGSLKDQADFFAKALGAGGSQPWMRVNEVRSLSELPKVDGFDVIPERANQPAGAKNDPQKTA